MNETKATEPILFLGPNDPPLEFQREEAAFAKVRERLVRDHPGAQGNLSTDDIGFCFSRGRSSPRSENT